MLPLTTAILGDRSKSLHLATCVGVNSPRRIAAKRFVIALGVTLLIAAGLAPIDAAHAQQPEAYLQPSSVCMTRYGEFVWMDLTRIRTSS